MTNHEKYQRAFSTLHPSRQWNMEGTEMKQTRKRYLPRAAIVCAAVVLVLALAATAYAADVGGIDARERATRRRDGGESDKNAA